MNTRTVLTLAIASFSLVTLAEKRPAARKPVPLTQEQIAAAKKNDEADVEKTLGGYLTRPGTQKGEIAYVNCQKRIPKAWIDEVAAYLRDETRFNIVCREGTFDFAAPKLSGNATLFVVDDAKLPAMLVAPENRWAVVNVAVVAKEQRPAFLEARTKKQLSRCFALLCGASNSQYPNSLTRGIVDEADLDKNVDYRLPLDVTMRFKRYMETYGVTPQQRVTYKKACREGWAPAPTNDVQKAIWDKVHALPTEPIKIKPETKKVRE